MSGSFADSCRRGPDTVLGCAWLAGIPPAVIWVSLTALDGRTYHLAPFVVAAAHGLPARGLGLRTALASLSVAVAGLLTGVWHGA